MSLHFRCLLGGSDNSASCTIVGVGNGSIRHTRVPLVLDALVAEGSPLAAVADPDVLLAKRILTDAGASHSRDARAPPLGALPRPPFSYSLDAGRVLAVNEAFMLLGNQAIAAERVQVAGTTLEEVLLAEAPFA